MDLAVLKVLSSGQSRNEKIRTSYTRTSARPKYGDSQENPGHAHQNLGPPNKKYWSCPSKSVGIRPSNSMATTSRPENEKWHTANVNKQNGVQNLQL